MLYSSAHKFIYSQLPRSGSTSTAISLRRYCGPPRWVQDTPSCPEVVSEQGVIGQIRRRGPAFVRSRFFVHMPLAEIKQEIGPAIWDSCEILSNIRNPFSRVVSLYNVRIKQGHSPQPADVDDARAELEQSLEIEAFAAHTHMMMHIDGTFAIDTTFPNETLDEALDTWAHAKGLRDFPQDRPRRQVSTNNVAGRPAEDLLTETVRSQILEHFGWFFDLFGYSRNVSDAHLPPAQHAPAQASVAS